VKTALRTDGAERTRAPPGTDGNVSRDPGSEAFRSWPTHGISNVRSRVLTSVTLASMYGRVIGSSG
jgi:hypothetical protein